MRSGVCALSFAAFATAAMAQDAEWRNAMERAQRAELAGRYVDAVDAYRGAADIAERFGPNDVRTWTTYNLLAIAYQNAGRPSESVRSYRREISLVKNALGKQNVTYAIAVANLGNTLMSMGRFSAAENLLRETLQIETSLSDASPTQIALTQMRLSQAMLGLGHCGEAERLVNLALPTIEKSGQNFDIAVALSTLGLVRRYQHRIGEALDLFRTTLAMMEKEYGPDHPMLLRPLTDVAVLNSLLGNVSEADAFFQRAQAISDKALPPDHPSRVTLLANYAEFLRRTGEKTRAKTMQQQANALARDNARREGIATTVDVSSFRGK